MPPDRSSTRSAHYQHVILEICCEPDTLAEKSDSQGFNNSMFSTSNKEELLDLREQFVKTFWRLVEQLTPRQQQVLKLYAKGLTQVQISKILKVNQSSITKSIHGNCDYRGSDKSNRKIYGGIKRKILKLAEEDPEMREITRRIAELQSDE